MSKAEKFWDRMASRYDNGTDSADAAYIQTVEITKKYLNSSDAVLDYACGTGTMSIEIAPYVQTIRAIDLSSQMITVAQGKAQERNITNIQFAQGTLFDADLQDESFDAVLALNVLHLLKDTPTVLQRIHALLKPGGYFVSSTACGGEKLMLGVGLSLLSKVGVLPYIKNFKIAELEAFITNAHFQIVEAEVFSDIAPNRFIVARKME